MADPTHFAVFPSTRPIAVVVLSVTPHQVRYRNAQDDNGDVLALTQHSFGVLYREVSDDWHRQ